MFAECHVARLQSVQIPIRHTPRRTDSQVDRTKSEHNPELTEPIEETILRGRNVMWLDSQVDKIQVDKHTLEQNPK